MVYFWQKQSRRNSHSSPKTAISPLLSAATTAADTVLAAVVSSKSEKRSHRETRDDIRTVETTTTTTAPTEANEVVCVFRGSNERGSSFGSDSDVDGGGGGENGEGGGGGREGSSNMRGGLSSTSCRGNSGVMTNKIQCLVLDKLSEYARRKQESNRRRVAERELDSLNLKIDKLLSKMDDGDVCGQGKIRQEDECVVCLAAPATMKTFPCGHRVVCRKCLIKTMQVAISQRCLPLRCVICRNRILSLQHSQDSERSGGICFANEGSNKNHSNSNNSNVGNVSNGHSGKISRSNTTPVIHNSTLFKSSFSSPSSPVSQQTFVPEQNHTNASSLHTMPSTSQGVTSNGAVNGQHCVAPLEEHASQSTSNMPQKKTSNKSVKRLLGTR